MRKALGALVLAAALSCPSYAEPYRPLDHLWYGTRDIPDRQNAWVLGAGAALTLGALTLDRDVHDYFAGHNRLGSAGRLGDRILGTGIPGALAGIGMVVYGLAGDSPHELDAGEAHLEGLAATAAYTWVLKLSVRRPRPDSRNRLSFPSGHASTVFASAASTMDMYGPAAGIPVLALGVYTGLARLGSNAHHLSDVLFGAALGYAVGHAYARHHRGAEAEKAEASDSALVTPYFDSRSECGLAAILMF